MAPEQHDTLDGVPEPSENPRLFGHREAVEMLAAAYKAQKLPHALLFAGTQGIGKATLAFHLAHHLLKFPTAIAAPETLATPDPASSLFRQIATGAHPAILHLTRPLNDKTKTFKTMLTVDEVRKVSRFLSMTSHDGGYRIVIADPADDMNANAANALLKNLEEPPARTIFILITHSPGRLLPTIRSRCQMVRLSPLDPDSLLAALADVDAPPPREAEARASLVERAGGSARTAMLLTQYGGLEIADAIDRLVAAPALDITAAHKLSDVVSGRGREVQFDIFNSHVVDMLATEASRTAQMNELARADRLSRAWQEATNSINDMATYNLDKKQHALTVLARAHDAMRM